MENKFPRKAFRGIKTGLCECGHNFDYHFESAEIKIKKGCIKCKCKKFTKSENPEVCDVTNSKWYKKGKSIVEKEFAKSQKGVQK